MQTRKTGLGLERSMNPGNHNVAFLTGEFQGDAVSVTSLFLGQIPLPLQMTSHSASNAYAPPSDGYNALNMAFGWATVRETHDIRHRMLSQSLIASHLLRTFFCRCR